MATHMFAAHHSQPLLGRTQTLSDRHKLCLARHHPNPHLGIKRARTLVNTASSSTAAVNLQQPAKDAEGTTEPTNGSSTSSTDTAAPFNSIKAPVNVSVSDLWELMRPDWPLILACAVATVISVGTFVCVAPSLGRVIDVIGSQNSSIPQLLTAVGVLGATYLISNATLGLQVTLALTAGERVAARIRSRLFSALLRGNVAFYDSAPTGAMANWLGQDVEVVNQVVGRVLGARGLRSVLEALGILLALVYLSWPVALVMALTAPLILPAVGPLTRRIKAASRKSQENASDLSAAADEIIENMRVVKVFQSEAQQTQRYNALARIAHAAALHVIDLQGLLDVSGRARNTVSLLLALGLGSLLALAGHITVGTAYSFFVYSYGFAFALSNITAAAGDVSRAAGTIARTLGVLRSCEAQESHIQDHPGATIPEENFQGAIEFRNVGFKHPGGWEMRNISFSVPSGSTVALVGPSGGGKSTLAGLLLGLYKYTEGSILIDGIPLDELDLSWWRRQVGVVEQEPGLLAGTVNDIIRYGNTAASEESVKSAAETAHADGFIETLPQGYATVVGPGSVVELSGGQRQRLAIARAVLPGPTVLVLDEATSALDVEMEAAVASAVQQAVHGLVTRVVIAHRLSTVQKADNIVVLADGRVVEKGTHFTLMAQGDGVYAGLVRRARNAGSDELPSSMSSSSGSDGD